jgi:translocation and assembly module TamB
MAGRAKRWVRRSIIGVVAVVAVLVLVVLLVQTPWGKNALVDVAARMVSSRMDGSVTIGRVSGPFPFNVHVDHVELRDRTGTWLELFDLSVDTSFSALLRRRVHVEDLEIAQAVLHRRPERREPRLPDLPDLPKWLQVDRAHVARFMVGEELLQTEATFVLDGHFLPPGSAHAPAGAARRWDIRLEANRLDAEGTHAVVDAQLTAETLALTVNVRDEVLVPDLLEAEGPLELSLEGAGPLAGWHGQLTGRMGAQDLAQADIMLDVQEQISLSLLAAVQLTHPVVPAEIVTILGDTARIEVSGVLSEERVFTIDQGSATTSLASMRASGSLELQESRLDLEVHLRHDRPTVLLARAREDLEEDRDELPPAAAALRLQGALEDLAVALRVDLDETPVLEAQARVAITEAIAAEGRATMWPHGALLPDAVLSRLPGEIDVEFDGARDADGHVRLSRLVATGEGLELSAAGEHAPAAGTITAALEGRIEQLEQIVGDAETALKGSLEFRGLLQGDRDETTLTADLTAENLEVADGLFPNVRGRVEGGFAGGLDAIRDGRLIVSAQSDPATLQDKPVPAVQLEAQILAPDSQRLVLQSLSLTDGDATVQVSGTYVLEPQEAAFSVRVQAPLEPYREWLPLDATGIVDAEAQVAKGPDTAWTIDAAGRAYELTGLPDALAALVDASLSYAVTVQVGDNGIAVESASVTAAKVEATAQGRFDPETEELAFTASVGMPDLDALSATLNQELGGRLTAEMTGSGTLEALEIAGDVTVVEPTLGPLAGRRLDGAITVRDLTEAPRATVQATLQPLVEEAPSRPLELGAEVAVDDDVVRVPQFTLSQGPNRATGALELNRETNRAAGQAQFDAPDLAALEVVTRVAVGGRAEGNVVITEAGAVEASAEGQDLRWGELHVAAADLQVNAAKVYEAPTGEGRLELRRVTVPHGVFEQIHLDAQGSRSELAINATMRGTLDERIPVNFELAAEAAPDDRRFRLARLTGAFGDYPIALQEGGAFQGDPQGWRVDPTTVAIGEGLLRVEGVVSAATVAVEARLDEAPLGLIYLVGGPPLEGVAGGTLSITGTGRDPRGVLALALAQVKHIESPPDAPPATVRLAAELGSQRVAGDAELTAGDFLRAEGTAVLPLTWQMWPWELEIHAEAPLEGSLELEGDLAAAPTFIILPEHQIAGIAQAALSIGGTRAAPVVSGEGSLRNGRYENIDTGTILTNVEADVRGDRDTLVLDRFSAGAGPNGSVEADGRVRFEPGTPLDVDATIRLANARVIHRDDASARATGELRVHGTPEQLVVEGRLEAGPAEIGLAAMAGEDIPELEVIEVNVPEALAARTEGPGSIRPRGEAERTIALAMRVSAPGQIFARGRGLDSEWQGDLQVAGYLAEPRLRGTLTVVRGHMIFLGRRFDLVDSTLTFSGESPPSPYLNLNAVAESADVTARLAMTGTIDQLDLALTSDPPLPRDEILARVLFGRSLTQISPLQAIQLAHSAALLTGRVRGLPFLAGTSRLAGLDRIELRQTGTDIEDAAVAVGTYLGDRFYMEVEKGVGSGDTKATVEVDLTPQLKLEGEVGADHRQSIGLFWKRDY